MVPNACRRSWNRTRRSPARRNAAQYRFRSSRRSVIPASIRSWGLRDNSCGGTTTSDVTKGSLIKRSLIVIACVASLGPLSASASATPATIRGTVAGPGTPAAGEGVTAIRAVNAKTGAIGGADYTAGRRNRWSLRVTPGKYVLGAATVPFGGGKSVGRLLAFAAARSGKTEKVKLKLKRKRKRRHHDAPTARSHARVAEGFGDVDVDYPAIWVKQFDVRSQDPGLGVLRNGMAQMLITDLLAGFAERDCDAAIVERDRIQDVINEQRLQQLPGFDQGTAVRRGKLVRDNASVTGTITESGGQVRITAQYDDRRTGRTRSVSVEGAAASIFELEQELAKKLLDAICGGLPDAYAGTFNGSLVDPETTIDFSGNVTYERVKAPDPFAADCAATGIACFNSIGGSATWRVSTTPGATCSYSASPQTVAIPAGTGTITVDLAGGDTPGYFGALGPPDDTTMVTRHCPPEPPEQVLFHFMGCCFATNFGIPWGDYAQRGGWLLQGTRSDGAGVTQSWNLSGR